MKRSILIALLLAVAAVGWIASGSLGSGSQTPEARKPAAEIGEKAAPATVRTRRLSAREHQCPRESRGAGPCGGGAR